MENLPTIDTTEDRRRVILSVGGKVAILSAQGVEATLVDLAAVSVRIKPPEDRDALIVRLCAAILRLRP